MGSKFFGTIEQCLELRKFNYFGNYVDSICDIETHRQFVETSSHLSLKVLLLSIEVHDVIIACASCDAK